MVQFVNLSRYSLIYSNLNRQLVICRGYSHLTLRSVRCGQVTSHFNEIRKFKRLVTDIRWSSTTVSATVSNTAPHAASSAAANITRDEVASVAGDSVAPTTSQGTVSFVDAKTLLKRPDDDVDLSNFIVPEPPKGYELIKTDPLSYLDFDLYLFSPRAWLCQTFLFLENYMPFGGAVMLMTLVARIALFPLFIRSRRDAAETAVATPQLNQLVAQRTEAMKMGDDYEAFRVNNKIDSLNKQFPSLSPKRMLVFPLVTGFTFTAFFLTLRKMASYGHEGMKTGGFLTFADLTQPDTYYTLRTIMASSIFALIYLSSKMGFTRQVVAKASVLVDLGRRFVLWVVPALAFWVVGSQPAAFLLYWCTNNTISVILSLVLFIPSVRKYFKIPKYVPPSPGKKIPINWKNLVKDATMWWSRMQTRRGLRKEAKDISTKYERSGQGPIRKTFDYDPTKIRR